MDSRGLLLLWLAPDGRYAMYVLSVVLDILSIFLSNSIARTSTIRNVSTLRCIASHAFCPPSLFEKDFRVCS